MTEPYNGNLVIKLVASESQADVGFRREIAELEARIAAEAPAVATVRGPDCLEVVLGRESALPDIIDNRRVNREDRGEVYADIDPAASNLPQSCPTYPSG